jgi:hypothetical protein
MQAFRVKYQVMQRADPYDAMEHTVTVIGRQGEITPELLIDIQDTLQRRSGDKLHVFAIDSVETLDRTVFLDGCLDELPNFADFMKAKRDGTPLPP